MGLDRLVQRRERRLGGRVLGHVRRLGGIEAAVVQPGRFGRHQARELDLDLALGQRVGDALVGADRDVPDDALVGVEAAFSSA